MPKPKNFWEVLANSLSAGIAGYGEGLRQERNNDIQNLTAALQLNEEQRAAEAHKTNQLVIQSKLRAQDLELQRITEEAAKTTEQRAREKAQAEMVELKTKLEAFTGGPLVPYADNISGLVGTAQTQLPQGTKLDLGDLNISPVPLPELEKTQYPPPHIFDESIDPVAYRKKLANEANEKEPTAKEKQTKAQKSVISVANRFYQSLIPTSERATEGYPGGIMSADDIDKLARITTVTGGRTSKQDFLGFDNLAGDTKNPVLPKIFSGLVDMYNRGVDLDTWGVDKYGDGWSSASELERAAIYMVDNGLITEEEFKALEVE